MRDARHVAEVLEIAASSDPLLERAQALVESLDRWLPVDALWLTLCDPQSHVYATVGSTGLERPVLDYLERPSVAREIELAELNRDRPPVSVTELPVAVHDLPTWADCLIPAGFRDGLGVPLCEPGGPHVGLLSLLCADHEPPSAATRASIGRLAPLIARGLSPTRSLLATAGLVEGAAAGVVLNRDGATYHLPGLRERVALSRDSAVVRIARRTLLSGQVYRTFLWPEDDAEGPTTHARMTVLAAIDVPDFVLGTLLVSPHADCCGLTPRELEVLGLVVEGCSNQQIASRLTITIRTVASHLEHILVKLEVPTRTMAAVRAEREGWHVPPATTSGRC